MRRRTSTMGHSAGKNSRAEFFRTCCVSVNPNCMSITLGQPEDEVAEDQALDFRRARLDGVATRPQVVVRPLPIVEGARRALGELPVGAKHFLGDLLEALVELAPE